MAGKLIFFTLTAVIYKTNGSHGPAQLLQDFPLQISPNCNYINSPPLNIVNPQPYIGPQAVVSPNPCCSGPQAIVSSSCAVPQAVLSPSCTVPQALIGQPCIGRQVVSPTIITSSNCLNPTVATTILDNTLSNSLANTIQLLIVSKLIENTLNAGISPTAIGPVCEAIVNPCLEYAATPSNAPCEGVIESVVPNICADIRIPGYNLVPNVNVCGEVGIPGYALLPNVCGDVGIPGYALTEQKTLAPGCSNLPQTYGGFEYGLPMLSPVATEMLLPSEIPAQLTCNFGYMNTNVPCLTVNVEPIASFDGCYPVYGSGYFY